MSDHPQTVIMDQLLGRLTARINQSLDGEPSAVLEAAASAEAQQLREAVSSGDGDLRSAPPDVLTVLAYFHKVRSLAQPNVGCQDDLRTALSLFCILADRAPERVPQHLQIVFTGSQPELASDAQRLGAAAFSEYQETGQPEALDVGIDAFKEAVAATPPGHPHWAGCLANLGAMLTRRAALSGSSADLDAAIELGRQAVATFPDSDPRVARMLSNLAVSLVERFRLKKDRVDLDAAIDLGQRTVAMASLDTPGLFTALVNLESWLTARYKLAGSPADLDAAINLGRQVVAATPRDDPDLADRAAELGNCLETRFWLTGDRADLDAGIDVCRQAVAAAPVDHPSLAESQGSLAALLSHRFQDTRDDADLDAAVDAGRQAVATTPPGHPGLPGYLMVLGGGLATRFQRGGDLADLDAAIDAVRQAVAAATDDPGRVAAKADLGSCLRMRAEYTGSAADLDTAIDIEREVVATLEPGDPVAGEMLTRLGVSLLSRFKRTGDPADVDAAVEAGRRALDVTRPGDPDRAAYLSNLAITLWRRFDYSADAADLDAGIDLGRRAVAGFPPGHGDSTQALANLGAMLLARFDHEGDRDDLDAAIECCQQAARHPTAAPDVRMLSAIRWGSAAARDTRTQEAADGYAAALELLPLLAWPGLNRATQQKRLGRWMNLAGDAAACAILDGRPQAAVELLEQGRSVLWTQALNLRGDLTELADRAPTLAWRLDHIRKVLDTSAPPTRDTGTQQPSPDRRRQAARAWDEVVAEVRALDGFEHFLAAKPYRDLAAAVPADGPVVILTASKHGCHALIVSSGSEQPQVVGLPGLTFDTVLDHADNWQDALGSVFEGRAADAESIDSALLGVLEWLWDAVAAPVLTALGHTSAPDQDGPWPRVWWCPTGLMTMLPVHAAGHHPHSSLVGSGDSVPDRVISSYTSSLTTIGRARQPRPPGPVRHLAVGLPTTPGHAALPAVPIEMQVLARHNPAGRDNRQLSGAQATRARVLAAIPEHSWIHLSCHGMQDQTDPSRSGFALWDGMLSVTDLATLPTQLRQLAFLSACQTATGSREHLDEVIHLAATMQFLGYQHVIATMWSIADAPAPWVADIFYTVLAEGETLSADRAAQALHQAVRRLRQERPGDPLLWAPYIHLGP